MEKSYNAKQVAERWGLSTKTLQLWRSKGIGPRFWKFESRAIRYDESALVEYEQAHTIHPRPARQKIRRAA